VPSAWNSAPFAVKLLAIIIEDLKMKKLSIAVLLFALIASVAGGAERAYGADDSMNAFWEKFKAAVVKGDKETAAALSAFPISLGYRMGSIKNKAQFMKNYRYLFARETNAAKCFRTAKPDFDKKRPKEFTVGCPFTEDSGGDEPFVYTFKLTRYGWRFVGFENVNE